MNFPRKPEIQISSIGAEALETADDGRLWRLVLEAAAFAATLSRQHFYPNMRCMFYLSQ